jgi:hypothetical protein
MKVPSPLYGMNIPLHLFTLNFDDSPFYLRPLHFLDTFTVFSFARIHPKVYLCSPCICYLARSLFGVLSKDFTLLEAFFSLLSHMVYRHLQKMNAKLIFFLEICRR